MKIEIYIDFATIPTLNYFLNFIDTFEDKETIRLFALSRFVIPDSIVSQFPFGKIRGYKVDKHNLEILIRDFKDIVNLSPVGLEVNLHINLYHSLEILSEILPVYLMNKEKFTNVNLFFYDDGSEGIVTLYELSNISYENIMESVKYHKIGLINVFNGGRLDSFNRNVLRYLWNEVIPSTYFLYDISLLEHPNLIPIIKSMSSINKMNFDRFRYYNDLQKEIMLNLLDVNFSEVSTIIELSKNNKAFVFLGTTVFDVSEDDKEIIEKFHFNAIKEITLPNGRLYNKKDDFLFFYKGHPNSVELNTKIADNFKHLVIIPDKIAFEILMLLGFELSLIGGFAGTSLFGLRKNIISDQVFVTTKDEKYRGHYLYQKQYELSRTLLYLGYINQENIHFFEEFL